MRENTKNRFSTAGQALVGAIKEPNTHSSATAEEHAPVSKKDKVISAKVYPETWEKFTAINRVLGMTNNSALNLVISEYVREKEKLL